MTDTYRKVKISDMGELIGKYLRETNRIPKEDIDLSDYEIGEKVFNSHPKGELYPFFELYYEACKYYKIGGDDKC